MAKLIILLYALNGMFDGVPAGCFIAAWALFGVMVAKNICVAVSEARRWKL